MGERKTQPVRAESGGWLCGWCGEPFATEREARECGETDRGQWLTSEAEADVVRAALGF